MTNKTISHPKKTTAMAVANWFITQQCKTEQTSNVACPQMDQLKLYKLVYFAHAWWLGNVGTPLFDEDIAAWSHGPNIQELYSEFSHKGRKPIKHLGQSYDCEEISDKDIKRFLKIVWKHYSKYHGWQLSNLTHGEEEPWTKIRQYYNGKLDQPRVIPNDLIQKIYAQKVKAIP